jgi:hypothetical protein
MDELTRSLSRWANAIPDATADINFVINGTAVKFTGVGYHDSMMNLPQKVFVTTDI